MSVKNKKLVEKFINEFIKRNNKSYMNYLADDIKWNIVGMPSITGRQNFLEALEMMELWQASLKRSNSEGKGKNVIAEGDYVVIENQGSLLVKDKDFDNPAHCDIYRIDNGKIKEVTTYIVDTSING